MNPADMYLLSSVKNYSDTRPLWPCDHSSCFWCAFEKVVFVIDPSSIIIGSISRGFWGWLMRRQSIAIIAAASTVAFTQVASAADLPRKAPAYAPPPPAFSWTGFYVGAHAGYR
jgi:hypothetical protein